MIFKNTQKMMNWSSRIILAVDLIRLDKKLLIDDGKYEPFLSNINGAWFTCFNFWNIISCRLWVVTRAIESTIWALENFLGASEVEEFSQNEQNLKSSFEISRWIFEKFFNNVFFLASKLIYASYDHKNWCVRKPWSRSTF